MDESLRARLSTIKLLVLDVDGVLTDGSLYFGAGGEELKKFNILDGLGIKLLQKSGVKVGIISGRQSQMVARRAKDLGLLFAFQGREDKHSALSEAMSEHSFESIEVAFMGDDLPDLEVINIVGVFLTVPNSHWFVRDRAHWVSRQEGGKGAVREACDAVLEARGALYSYLENYVNFPFS